MEKAHVAAAGGPFCGVCRRPIRRLYTVLYVAAPILGCFLRSFARRRLIN